MPSANISYSITGFEACKDYNYACFIADSLSQILHNFTVIINTKKFSEWKNWLEETCKFHDWIHSESPLIWRENDKGGKPVYIGGVEEFKTWLRKYYKIDAKIPNSEQEVLNLDYALAQNIELRAARGYDGSKTLNVIISGASSSICSNLAEQLLSIEDTNFDCLSIKLYDESGCCCETLNILENISNTECKLLTTEIVENLSDGLKDCDILIILDHLTREAEETNKSWLSRNYQAIKDMAEEINKSEVPPRIKVIFCSRGPVCFCANALVEETNKLNKNNVVTVSAHCGLEMTRRLIDVFGISDDEISSAPTWGFMGINHYVDIHHSIQKSSVYIPNKRALAFDRHSTLPLGSKFDELRWLQYLTMTAKSQETLSDCTEVKTDNEENSLRCKVVCDLLKLWYAKDRLEIGDEIISLGIISDGSFNIPKGIFFSQPAYLKILDDNSVMWVPCSEFPTPNNPNAVLEDMVTFAKSILQSFELFHD
ncbi:hypothetical protein QAD02_004973 [Eretmocerus hayati]|uniref:Uncharacterized protein n=1 Tax=Eretmocerus hayati TaxID=131215 RepID=A0ACC2NS58_9HYME|nr:hypothetical protein QAD02_004973 [Eretmocerus hayati]